MNTSLTLTLANTPTTHITSASKGCVRIVGYHRSVTAAGFRKGPDRRYCAFAHGEVARGIHNAVKDGLIGKGDRVRVELNTGRDNAIFCNSLSLAVA